MNMDSYSFFALAAAATGRMVGEFFPCKLSEWSAEF